MPDKTLPALKNTPGRVSPHDNQPHPASSQHPSTAPRALAIKAPPPPPVQEYIPEDILYALKKPPAIEPGQLPPAKKGGRPENAWFFNEQTRKYQHLVNNPPCTCGAGPKDISFLYDVASVQAEKTPAVEARKDDKSLVRKEELDKLGGRKRQETDLPETLIPKEFHLVQSKATIGLKYNKEKFAAKPVDHEKHLTVFPSLKPASRREIMELRNLMDKMLEGIAETSKDIKEHEEDEAPTQMHNLLNLIKQEQDIYNLVFHEIIRQATVECKERGEILAALRQRYATLLDKVPRQVRSMHAEVMAQRALDRRLTEELLKFKSAINILTKELTEAREHEQKVAEQSLKAKEELKNSLIDSEKNANLLTEYHDLYELQRQRLEHQISVLSEEKEIWSGACYTMAVKITENNRLNTAKRLHMAEKSWSKLASHYALFLSDRDCELMAQVQSHVDRWREIVTELHSSIVVGDNQSMGVISALKDDITSKNHKWHKTLINADNKINQPNLETVSSIYEDIKNWLHKVSNEVDKYSGETLMKYQEQHKQLQEEITSWNEVGRRVFLRHPQDDGSNFGEYDSMLALNEELQTLMNQLNTLILGENGSAKYLIQLSNEIELWEVKLHSVVNGATQLAESDWFRFLNSVRSWPALTASTLRFIGSTQPFQLVGKPHKELPIEDAMKSLQVWISSATSGIDNEGQKLIDMVASLHKSVIHWMVQVLLKLAPDRPDNAGDSYNATQASVEQIEEQGEKLIAKLIKFSDYLTTCCGSAVMDPSRGPAVDTDAEYRDLKKITKECNEWCNTARILVQEIKGDVTVAIGDVHHTDRQDTIASTLSDPNTEAMSQGAPEDGAAAEPDVEPPLLGDQSQQPPETPRDPAQPKEPLHAICTDKNVRTFDLEQQRQQQEGVNTDVLIEKAELGSKEEPRQAYEAIAAMEQLQSQIAETELRAQQMETRALEAERQLKEALEKMREAEITREAEAKAAERKAQEEKENAEAEQAKKEDAEIAAERAKQAAAAQAMHKEKTKDPSPSSAKRKTSTGSQGSAGGRTSRSSAGTSGAKSSARKGGTSGR